METQLLSACFKSRDSYDLILNFINVKSYSREFNIIIAAVGDYYARDGNAKQVNRELFLAQLAETVSNNKHLERFTSLVDEAFMHDTSVENVNDLVLKAKLHEVGEKLAVALVNKENTKELVEEYQRLSVMTHLDELTGLGTEILTVDDIDDVLSRDLTRQGLYRFYPLAVNERLEGGVRGGHHIVTFARPEMGKTAFNITVACGFARQGAPGIYFINEDRVEDLYIRCISNLTGLSRREIEENPGRAKEIALSRGLGNIRFISLSPGTPAQVEAFVDKFRPAWIVMDQLRNLAMKEANKVLQLEYATSALRNIGKKYNVIVVSTTQAGDSAEGKDVLSMGDVDFSNTGVAAQADVMIGIGATPNHDAQGIRILNLCKNKISGRHENFPCRIHPLVSRYSSFSDRGPED